jgi:hypothetical protein
MIGTSRHWLPAALGGLILLTLSGAGGCQQGDLAERQLRLRGRRLTHTADVLVEAERRRPKQLTRTLNQIDRSVRWHAQASPANLDEIESYWRNEWRRWLQCQPLYRREASRILRGEAEHIEPNAILMFF